jgi:PAS domain S-box-containing protein
MKNLFVLTKMGCISEETEIDSKIKKLEKLGFFQKQSQNFLSRNNKNRLLENEKTDYKLALNELKEIINFIEKLSLKLYGDFTVDDVYRIVIEEFQSSNKYTGSILLLSKDKKYLNILSTSHTPSRFRSAEKIVGYNVKNFKISLEKSHIYNQVINENKTINFEIQDLLKELFPKKLALIICRILGFEKTKHVATPLIVNGKTIGAFAMSSTMLIDNFIPSIKNVAIHITKALERAKQNIEIKQKNEKLKESEKEFEILINQSLQGIVIIQDFHIVFVNNKFAEITGYNVNELLSLQQNKVKSLVHPDDQDLVWGSMQARLKGKNVPPNYEFRGIRKDGTECWLEIYASKLFYKGKSSILGAIVDITNRKKAELKLIESKKHFQKLFSTMVDPIVIVNSKGNFLDVNKKVEEITGLKREYYIGKNFLKTKIVTKKSKVILLKNLLLRMAGEKIKPYEVEILTRDGNKIPFEINAQKIDYFGNRADIVSFRDISERKKAEKELKEAHNKLKSLNKELEKKVEMRTSEIKHLLHQKNEFINQLGHDLKNPLNPIVNLLPILEKSEPDNKNKEIFKVLIRNANYMKKLVTKTIDLGRLNSSNSKFFFEDVNLFSEFNNIISDNEILFKEKNIQINNNIPDNIIVYADKFRMDELITNLLNNAAKYTKCQGNITLDAKSINNNIIVSIKDSGVGMTDDQLEHIFDEFYKVDPARHDFDSSGLGLTICKRIVEIHKGKIWVESKGLGKGSTFYFTIPKNKEDQKKSSMEYIYNQIDEIYKKNIESKNKKEVKLNEKNNDGR